jgi:hypothetical protein
MMGLDFLNRKSKPGQRNDIAGELTGEPRWTEKAGRLAGVLVTENFGIGWWRIWARKQRHLGLVERRW